MYYVYVAHQKQNKKKKSSITLTKKAFLFVFRKQNDIDEHFLLHKFDSIRKSKKLL